MVRFAHIANALESALHVFKLRVVDKTNCPQFLRVGQMNRGLWIQLRMISLCSCVGSVTVLPIAP
jgi:hypothetical protein